MKVITLQRVRQAGRTGALVALILTVAFCKPLLANPLDEIDNEILKSYTTAELQNGAWSLQVPARAVYRDAIETLEAGDRDMARRKLLLAARMSGDYSEPMFALARIDLRSGKTDFIIHLIEGYKRKVRGFYGQALLAANGVILLTTVSFAVLFLTLIFLLVRHWPEYDHKIREIYGGKFAFPPARFIGIRGLDPTAPFDTLATGMFADLSPDGRYLAFEDYSSGMARIQLMEMEGAGEPITLVSGTGNYKGPAISPDCGCWVGLKRTPRN